jgi:hypothetical protein
LTWLINSGKKQVNTFFTSSDLCCNNTIWVINTNTYYVCLVLVWKYRIQLTAEYWTTQTMRKCPNLKWFRFRMASENWTHWSDFGLIKWSESNTAEHAIHPVYPLLCILVWKPVWFLNGCVILGHLNIGHKFVWILNGSSIECPTVIGIYVNLLFCVYFYGIK